MSRNVLAALVAGLAAVASITTAAPAAAVPTTDPALVATSDGLVRGRVSADHRVFEGIPYAAPPVGDLRLRAPRPVRPWTGERDATRPGSRCAQVYAAPGYPPAYSGGEDCLYLNLHVPRGAGDRLPVLVFLHGGGGVGAGSGYDPRRITAHGVIVVTINYRLGALGFLHHPGLGDPAMGNYGIADQQAALAWVRRNVAAFGGDTRNVTLWGESGGGSGVCAQLASPAARGLFDKAIVQSAPCGNDFVTGHEATGRARDAAASLGCSDPRTIAACLRAVPVERIAGVHADRFRYSRHTADLPWFPVAGTPMLPLQPLTAARLGIGSSVPTIIGGTRDEMRALLAQRAALGHPPVTAAEYPRLIEQLYGHRAGAVLAEYPAGRAETPGATLATVLTDEGRFQGTCRQLPYRAAVERRATVFGYEFAEPTGRSIGDTPEGATHGADIPYFFDSYFRPPAPKTPEQQRLATTLIRHWTTFARTGTPGHGWTSDGTISFSTTAIGPVDLATTHNCAFWN